VPRINKGRWTFLFFLIILLFFFAYSALSIRRHERFDSFAYDLGIFDQAVWQYSRFKIPFSTIKGKIILGDHFDPTLALLGPLFWLWNDVRMLLLFQAAWLAFSSYPVFLLAKKKKLPGIICFLIGGLYLAFFGFQHALNFDFHTTVIAAGLASWIIYFWEKEDWRKFAFLAILFVCLKENLALSIFSLGLISFLRRKRTPGLIAMIVSLAYFLLAIKVFVPYFSPMGYEYEPVLPNTPLGVLTGIFWPKIKLETWFYSLSWFAFLPIFSPLSLLPVLIDLAQYFLAGEKYAATWGLFMHYRTLLAPFLAWGAIEGLVFLKKKLNIIYLIPLIVLPALVFQYCLHLPLNRLVKKYYWQDEIWMKNNRSLIRKVPVTASVATQNNLLPHLSHRDKIYLVWPRIEKDQWWLFWPGRPEYLLVDLHPNQVITHILVNSEVELGEAVENMEVTGNLTLVESIGEVYLYKINNYD
jgi:uncharacterized membrane protein